MFFGRKSIGLARMYRAILMLGRRVNRVELKFSAACIYHIMINARRYYDSTTISDRMLLSIEHHPTLPALKTEKLIELVHFSPDIFARL